MTVTWFDLPVEIRLCIMQHYCAGMRFRLRAASFSPRDIMPSNLLLVSKSFATASQVTEAMLQSGNIMCEDAKDLHKLWTSLNLTRCRRVRSLALSLDSLDNSDPGPDKWTLWRIQVSFPNLTTLLLERGKMPTRRITPQLLVCNRSMLWLLAQKWFTETLSVTKSPGHTASKERQLKFNLEDEYEQMFLYEGQASGLVARQCVTRSHPSFLGTLTAWKTSLLVHAISKVPDLEVILDLDLILRSAVGTRQKLLKQPLVST